MQAPAPKGKSKKKKKKKKADDAAGYVRNVLRDRLPLPPLCTPVFLHVSRHLAHLDCRAAAAANEPGWGVLRDDFMLGAKLRDWDKGGDGDGQADATAVTAAALEFSDSG